jgi:hypothetical protein
VLEDLVETGDEAFFEEEAYSAAWGDQRTVLD